MVFGIIELYEYASAVRSRFLVTLAELPWDVLERNREASHYSMKNIIIHMIQNEEWMVNWAIQGNSTKYTWTPYNAFPNFVAIQKNLEDVERRTRDYLRTVTAKELSRKVLLTLSSGESFELTVEECLFQSFTEQIFHLGELVALLWQEDIEPPKMQWFYNNPRGSKNDS